MEVRELKVGRFPLSKGLEFAQWEPREDSVQVDLNVNGQ